MDNSLDIDSMVKQLGKHKYRYGISKRTGWYQDVSLLNTYEIEHSVSDCNVSRKLIRLMDWPICGKRVIDLGCNAGLYAVELAVFGASCLGLESKPVWLAQADLVRKSYELALGRQLDVEFRQVDLMELDKEPLERFDYALLIGVATEIGLARGVARDNKVVDVNQRKLIKTLSGFCGSIIIRSRECVRFMSKRYYNSVFGSIGFSLRSTYNTSSCEYLRYDAKSDSLSS